MRGGFVDDWKKGVFWGKVVGDSGGEEREEEVMRVVRMVVMEEQRRMKSFRSTES